LQRTGGFPYRTRMHRAANSLEWKTR
jgi:hypothetical protein